LSNRRRFIATSAASSLLLLGCNQPAADTSPATSTVRRNVPLRILLCGNRRWAETMTTAWSGIAEQPLQINVLDPAEVDAESWQGKAIEAVNVCDVAIVPTGLLAALDEASALTPLNETMLGESGLNAITFYPVLREGAMKFAGRIVAVPQGAVQPAVVQRTDGDNLEWVALDRWDAYIETISKLSHGKSEPVAAEPLAEGGAVQMFLWRANVSNPPVWLFDRETFAPVIDTKSYVDVLETMKQCVSRYGKERLTAGEVWSRIATGKLRMAIAWPAAHSKIDRIEEAVDCQFSPLPKSNASDLTPVQTLVSDVSPVAIISSHCRQSEAAQRFIRWVAGGEGTSMLRDAVTGLTELRSSSIARSSRSTTESDETPSNKTPSNKTPSNKTPSNEMVTDRYDAILSKALSSLSIRTPLQLMQYRKYTEVLDAAVLSCLSGDQTPQAALSAVSKSWSELTESVGVKLQAKAWRKAQGLSG